MQVVYVTLILCCAFVSELCAQQWPDQVPFWPFYPLRSIQVLDGTWEFGYINDFSQDVTSTHIDTTKISTPNRITVPSAFDNVPQGYLGPRGTAFYRTNIHVPANQTALINFMACSFYCNVFVDNVNIGDHRAGGYVPFWLTIPPSTNTNRTIFVISDNRWNSTTAPVHTGGDYYFYGGIHRSAIVHTSNWLGTLFIQRLEISTTDYVNGLVNISVVLDNTPSKNVSLRVTWDDNSTFVVSLPAVSGVVTIANAKVPNAKQWNIGSPNLHTVTVSLLDGSTAVDAIQARFGIRVLGIDAGRRLTINGQRTKLHGHNRHHMYPGVGPSLSLANIQDDIKMFQDLNSNYMRGGTYPHDQRLLDICDEVGIVIWEEAMGPDVTTANIEDSYFMQYQLQQINEMISASYNHPSVILFAFFNEGPSENVSSCTGYAACASAVHQRTKNQLATWANDKGLDDQCLKYSDVLSFNSYPAWYQGSGNYSYPLSFWPSLLTQAAAAYSQPLLVSETGCEGLYEWINTSSVIWGQEYQLQVIPNDIFAILNDSHVSGLTLWVFADFKGNDEAQTVCGPCNYYPNSNNATYINVKCNGTCGLGCRPCGENHKGTVDQWRRKKLVYPVVQKLYSQTWD